MKKNSRIAAAAVLCICAAFIFYFTQKNNKNIFRMHSSVDIAMGTVISQNVYGGYEDVNDDILRIINELEAEKLSWRLEGSEVSAINESAGDEKGIKLSDKMQDILCTCMAVSRASGGAFDITIGQVTELWNIDYYAGLSDVSGFRIPKPDEISHILENSGYDKITLDGGNVFIPENMSVDLGAVGKGIALDEIKAYLDELNDRGSVTGALISAGGSILTYGSKPDKSHWKIAIASPFDQGETIGYIEVEGCHFISTSGDYERYVEYNGKRYHHIINPDTGYPAESGLKSVTIVADDGLISDALSTACFVLGQEKGLELVEKEGVEGIFVDCDGNITTTDGIKEYFHLSN